jgi:hypothetical protein
MDKMVEDNTNKKQVEDMIEYYRKYVDGNNYNFEVYNYTSVQNMFIPMVGMYGSEPKELAIKLMKKFIKWYKINKSNKYYPEHGCQLMCSISCLEGSITIAEEYTALSPEEKLKLIDVLIKGTDNNKTTNIVTPNEKAIKKIRGKMSDNDMVNMMAIGGGAFLGWALSHVFL